MGTFKEKVCETVSKIPRGAVLTYGEVAERSGSPKAARAVGNILSRNKNPNIPCHRVVRSDGSPGKYRGGEKEKKRILKKEGAI